MEDIFESLKTFVLTEEDLARHPIIPFEPVWNKGLKGYKTQPCSEETKNKISKSKKGKPAHNKGMPMSIEQKEKIRLAKLGKPSHWKGMIGEGTAMYGKSHSEDTKKKQSEAAKGKPKTHLKGKPRSAETKRKIAESQAKRHALKGKQ